MKPNQKLQLELTEEIIATLIKKVGPHLLVTALNNVSSHGEIFRETEFAHYLYENDSFLSDWFAGIDKLRDAADLAKTDYYEELEQAKYNLYVAMGFPEFNYFSKFSHPEYDAIVIKPNDITPQQYLKNIIKQTAQIKKSKGKRK